MKVNTQARNKTLQQVKQYPHYFAAKSFVQGFNSKDGPPPYQVMRSIITGRFGIFGRPKQVWQYRSYIRFC